MKLKHSHEADTKHVKILERISELNAVVKDPLAPEDKKRCARTSLGKLKAELNGANTSDER